MKEIILILGLAALIGIVLFNRHRNEKSLKLLTDEQRGHLLNHFSGFRIYSLYALFAVIGLYWLIGYLDLFQDTGALYTLLLVVYLLVTQWLTMKKLKGIDLPAYYVDAQKNMYRLRLVGMGLFVLSFLLYTKL